LIISSSVGPFPISEAEEVAGDDDSAVEVLACPFEEGLVGVGGDEVGEDEELDLGLLGDLTGFFGAGVIPLEAGGDFGRVHAVEMLGQIGFEHKHVGAASKADKVFIRAGVAGDDDGFAAGFEFVAVGGFDGAMVNSKGGDAEVGVLIDDSCFDRVHVDFGAGGGMHFGEVAADADVFGEEAFEAASGLSGSFGAVEFEWSGAAEDPGGGEEVGQAGDVVGVKVSEKDGADGLQWELGRGQAHDCAAARVHQKSFAIDDDGGGRASAIRVGPRVACAKQNHLHGRRSWRLHGRRLQRLRSQSEFRNSRHAKQSEDTRGRVAKEMTLHDGRTYRFGGAGVNRQAVVTHACAWLCAARGYVNRPDALSFKVVLNEGKESTENE